MAAPLWVLTSANNGGRIPAHELNEPRCFLGTRRASIRGYR
jgi:hypothetical protein